MNVATIEGQAMEPELRFTPNGKAVCNLTVLIKGRKDKKTGDRPGYFMDVTFWEDMAEKVAEHITKSDRVQVCGYLNPDEWEDNDGNTRRKLKMTGRSVGPEIRFHEMPDDGGGWSDDPVDDDDVPF